MEAKIGGKEL